MMAARVRPPFVSGVAGTTVDAAFFFADFNVADLADMAPL